MDVVLAKQLVQLCEYVYDLVPPHVCEAIGGEDMANVGPTYKAVFLVFFRTNVGYVDLFYRPRFLDL